MKASKDKTLINYPQSGRWIPESEQVSISHWDVISITCIGWMLLFAAMLFV